MWTEMSDPAILDEIGKRFREIRINKNIQQLELAEMSGVSVLTIIRFEKGGSISTQNLIKLMRALRMLENLSQLLPEQPISPIQMKKMLGKNKRMRVTKKL